MYKREEFRNLEVGWAWDEDLQERRICPTRTKDMSAINGRWQFRHDAVWKDGCPISGPYLVNHPERFEIGVDGKLKVLVWNTQSGYMETVHESWILVPKENDNER